MDNSTAALGEKSARGLKPRIVFLSMMFAPEPTGFAPMVTDLANYLSEHGWEVTVVTTFPQAPYWRVYSTYRGRWYQRETLKSVNLERGRIYIPRVPRSGAMTAWRRILFDSSFALTALLLSIGIRRPDLLVAVSPPLQAALPALVLKARWRVPTFMWIQDIVPDAAMSTGMMRPGPMLHLAHRFETFVYKRIDQIGVIAPGFRDNLERKGVPPEKLFDVPNWGNVSLFENSDDGERVRAELGYGNQDFVVMHAGSVATKQCLENAIRAMKILESDSSFHLVVIGDGNRLAAVQQEAARSGVSRVRFLPPRSGQGYLDVLRAADTLLLNQCAGVTDALIPSKLLSYLPSDRPIVAAVNLQSEAAKFLHEGNCALLVEPERPDLLAAAIRTLSQDSNLRRRLADAGRKKMLLFDRAESLPRFASAFDELLVSRRSQGLGAR